jgi:uncharacterized protein
MSCTIKSIRPPLQIVVATTFFQRAFGLLGRSKLGSSEGMYFPGTSSIHTFGMSFPIDLVYLNKEEEIIEIRQSMQPFRFSWCRGAQSVCELAPGAVAELGLQKGQKWPVRSYI